MSRQCVVKIKKRTVGAVQIKAESMSTCRIRRVVITKGCAFASAAVPRKKGYVVRNVTIKISSNLHSICLQFPSMCVLNLRMKCGSSSDENRINEYTSKKKGRTYEGLCFWHLQPCQKKRLVCSKCDDQMLLQFAQHLPLGYVNVW